MVELSQVTQIDKVADLGAGDGRIAVAFAHEGAWVDAYEIDEGQLVLLKKGIKNANVESHIKVIKKDFWNEDLSSYDIICIYPMPGALERLEKKLQKELHKGARVLLNYYSFPSWQLKKTLDKINLYEVA